MLNFFRKIRRKLADQNKFVQYSRYAIGEIILVMVGILLALQVNNWNERKKQVVKEMQVLKEIKSELTNALSDLNNDLEDLERNLNSAELIYKSILKKEQYHDSMRVHFMLLLDDERFTAKKSAFESLKSMGLETISNESLRHDITSIYLLISRFTNEESSVNLIAYELKKIFRSMIRIDRNVLISDLDQFDKTLYGNRNIPFKFIDYNNFLGDDEYLSTLLRSIQLRNIQIFGFKQFAEGIEYNISNIDEELNKLRDN